MGRKQKDTVDYFPFVIKDGKTLFVMQRKYGLAGIGFFTQIMRMLGQTPGHYYVYVDEYDKDRLNDYCGLSESDTRAMLADMAKTGKIDRELWETRDVIYSQAFVDELEELYRKRKTDAPTREMVIEETEIVEEVKTPGKRGFPPESADISGNPPESADFRQHSIVEDSIVEDSIVSGDSTPATSDALSPLKDELANQYQNAFTSETPAQAWKSIPQERKHLNDLAKRTRSLSQVTGRDPEELAASILDRYAEMKRTGRKEYWKGAPFTPSGLTTRWDAVVESLKQDAEVDEVMIF